MKLGGRLAAAVEVLADLEARHRPVAEALKDWGLGHRFAGAGDRAVIGNIVYDALRWRASSSWAIGADTPRAVVLAAVARRWPIGLAGVSAALAADPHAPPAFSEAEATRLATADLADAPPEVRADIPDWLSPAFADAFGEAWPQEGAGLALRPPLDMRTNRLKAEPGKVMAALARFGAAAAPFAPDGVRIAPTSAEARHPNVQVEASYQKGQFEIQDEGSQLAACLVGARAGEQVLDICAGAGGKTLALAAIMGNKGQVHATDTDRARLAPIHERLKRAGARNVQVRPAGAVLDDLAGRMDRVLIDAPCTGSGTWRRRPDAKWRLTERAVAERVGDQAAILDAAVRFVKPAGTLTYVTCSVLPAENDGAVAAFLARHPDFSAVTAPETVAGAFAGDLAARFLAAIRITAHGLQMTPARTCTDGFFVATLRRG